MKIIILRDSRNWLNSLGFTLGSVNLKKIIFVSIYLQSSIQGRSFNRLPSNLAIWWSLWRLGIILLRQIKPIAAIWPGFLSIPPKTFRQKLNFSMKEWLPTTIDPMGAQSPLLKQNITEEHFFAITFGYIPNATQALKMRAPSKWTCRPSSIPISAIAFRCSSE